MGGTWRGLAIASTTWVLAGLGCGDDPEPASAADGDGSSAGPAPEPASTTADPEPAACWPGQTQPCYDGPPGTQGVGACAAGQQTCTADGLGWSACAGQVQPEPRERCDTPQDDDCDGLAVCEPTLAWWQEIPGSITHVAARADGGVVAAGGGYGEFQGAWLEGMFVLALDADGQRVWSHSAGTRSYAWPEALAVDATGAVVVAGTYDGSLDLGGGPLPDIFGLGGFAARYAPDGAHVWSRGVIGDEYVAIALGPDGTSYLAGGYIMGNGEPESPEGSVRVEAIAADGTLAWLLPGQGAWDESNISLMLAPAGGAEELWLVSMVGGPASSLGDLPFPPSVDYAPIVVRIGLDGTPLAQRRLLDPRHPTYQIQAFARPGGMLVGATTAQPDPQGGFDYGVTLAALDEALEPVSERFVDDDTWLESVVPYPDGMTVLTVDFGGLLELGPIGVGTGGTAVALVDDQGNARWIEKLYSRDGHAIASVAAAPDGAVFVAGYAESGVLADVPVNGTFVAALRP